MIELAGFYPQPPRPEWRDEYFRDAPALLKHCEEMRAWQRRSDDPFERADAELWSRLTPQQAQQVACGVDNIFKLYDATDEIGKAYRDECAARSMAGGSITETEFRERLARILGQQIALAILPAMEV
jgi:hypothetical protein